MCGYCGKWHICNFAGLPLIWDNAILEFNTEEAAKSFLEDYVKNFYDDYEEYCMIFGINFKLEEPNENAINCTNKRIYYDKEKDDKYLA